jgi:hypothetical protein
VEFLHVDDLESKGIKIKKLGPLEDLLEVAMPMGTTFLPNTQLGKALLRRVALKPTLVRGMVD